MLNEDAAGRIHDSDWFSMKVLLIVADLIARKGGARLERMSLAAGTLRVPFALNSSLDWTRQISCCEGIPAHPKWDNRRPSRVGEPIANVAGALRMPTAHTKYSVAQRNKVWQRHLESACYH